MADVRDMPEVLAEAVVVLDTFADVGPPRIFSEEISTKKRKAQSGKKASKELQSVSTKKSKEIQGVSTKKSFQSHAFTRA